MSQEIKFTTSGETDVDYDDDSRAQEVPRHDVQGDMVFDFVLVLLLQFNNVSSCQDVSPSEETPGNGNELAPKKQARYFLKFPGSLKTNSQSPQESENTKEISVTMKAS